MICYKDRSYCSTPTCKNKCGRKFTDQDRIDATKWWGGEDFPVAYTKYCGDEDENTNTLGSQ